MRGEDTRLKSLNAAIGIALILYGNTLAVVGALLGASFVYGNTVAFVVLEGVAILISGVLVLLMGTEVAPKQIKQGETVRLER
jgi:uncharacterized membrane protein